MSDVSEHPGAEAALGAIVTALGSAAFWHWVHDGLAVVSLICGLIMGIHGVYNLVKNHRKAP